MSMQNITETEKLEDLKKTNILLKEEIMKVEAIADALFELNTANAIIKGNVDLAILKKATKLKSPTHILKAIDLEARRISNILLELTLITSKGRDLSVGVFFEKINVNSIIADVIKRCKPLAYKRNISLTTKNIPTQLRILGDKVYLEKMLTNIINNSITYGNKNGHTVISVKKYKEFIEIKISDDGIGIAKEVLPHIFERFYREDVNHISNKNGTGLGLAIVKWIVEKHNGEIIVKSIKNKGSTFSICLPITNHKQYKFELLK